MVNVDDYPKVVRLPTMLPTTLKTMLPNLLYPCWMYWYVHYLTSPVLVFLMTCCWS